jgi:hypothetical protein
MKHNRGSLYLAAAIGCGLLGCTPQPWVAQPQAAPPPFQKPAPPPSGGEIQQVSGRYSTPQQARVNEVGRKLLEGNKPLALKPRFDVVPGTQQQLSHAGEHQISISEGLVNACETDGQLAALLAAEMGRMVAARQERQAAAQAEEDRLPPIDVGIGPDGGGYGPQARQAELAKLGFNRRKSDPVPPPDADLLARQILTRGGFAAAEMNSVQHLLRR